MEPRLNFVTLVVADLDRARRFYTGGLGWTAALDVPAGSLESNRQNIVVRATANLTTPEDFVGNVTGDLNRRRGLIVNSEERGNTAIRARSRRS